MPYLRAGSWPRDARWPVRLGPVQSKERRASADQLRFSTPGCGQPSGGLLTWVDAGLSVVPEAGHPVHIAQVDCRRTTTLSATAICGPERCQIYQVRRSPPIATYTPRDPELRVTTSTSDAAAAVSAALCGVRCGYRPARTLTWRASQSRRRPGGPGGQAPSWRGRSLEVRRGGSREE